MWPNIADERTRQPYKDHKVFYAWDEQTYDSHESCLWMCCHIYHINWIIMRIAVRSGWYHTCHTYNIFYQWILCVTSTQCRWRYSDFTLAGFLSHYISRIKQNSYNSYQDCHTSPQHQIAKHIYPIGQLIVPKDIFLHRNLLAT